MPEKTVVPVLVARPKETVPAVPPPPPLLVIVPAPWRAPIPTVWEAPAALMSKVAPCRIVVMPAAVLLTPKVTVPPESFTVPSLMTALPVKALAPLRTITPGPFLVKLAPPAVNGEETENSFAGLLPPTVKIYSLVVPERKMPVYPEIPPAPPELSKRMPPREVAVSVVMVSKPSPVKAPPEPLLVSLSELAAKSPVVAALPLEK